MIPTEIQKQCKLYLLCVSLEKKKCSPLINRIAIFLKSLILRARRARKIKDLRKIAKVLLN